MIPDAAACSASCRLLICGSQLIVLRSVNFDVILLKQPRHSRQGELRLLQCVSLRVDEKVIRRSEIHVFQQCVAERCPGKVTMIEQGAGEVGFREIGFVKRALFESGLSEIEPGKRAEIDFAVLKLHGEEKWIALFKMDPQKLASFERHVVKPRLRCLGVAQVTAGKLTC
jgi:hypothetical protein